MSLVLRLLQRLGLLSFLLSHLGILFLCLSGSVVGAHLSDWLLDWPPAPLTFQLSMFIEINKRQRFASKGRKAERKRLA